MSTINTSYIINYKWNEICKLSKQFKKLNIQEVKANKAKQNKCIMEDYDWKKEAS
jgi:hypothetical protein